MAGLCEGGNEPSGSLKAIYTDGEQLTTDNVARRVPNLARGGARVSHGPPEHHRTPGLGALRSPSSEYPVASL
ncbi:hypothetical protein ANN_01730 [Periplaneta americana]|uniref:Uncharacterized protein n=1 Tax=Periplaneta americana TaxID=6978 RepID=A0ABQ8TUB7_PERAM|nr:hypothetical protein ANN_01730 [Periplaneta americana]